MSVSVNNTQTLIFNTQLNHNNRVAFKANSNQKTIPKYTTDTVKISTKKKGLSDKTKLCIGIGAALIVTLTAIICHKKLPAYKINKKFADLENKLPEVQQTFKDIFLKDDLSIEQTKEILQRYKDLEKLRIDKNISIQEYGKAVLDVAAKNYGLEHANIQLTFAPFKDSKAGGCWQVAKNTISIKNNVKKEWLFGAIHHELRHAKQSQAVFENLSEKDIMSYLRQVSYNNLKEMGIEIKDFESWCKEVWTPEFKEVIFKDTGKRLKRSEIKPTSEGINYAEKMKKAEIDYVDIDKDEALYWTNDREIDARKAETLINKLFGLNKREVNYYDQKDAKYKK